MTDASTVLDAILASLVRASQYNANDQVAPAVVLWTDHDHQWEPLVGLVRERLPQLLTLGEYSPGSRTGPAIWLRTVIARKLPEIPIPVDSIPILYLPGISRQQLRAVEECSKPLQPLAELQYRGVFWTQVNAKDWTICAFLKSQHGGLGLNVARDAATQEAIRRVLRRLVEEPVERLRSRHIDAPFLNGLLTPDPVRDLLEWLSSPDATRTRWGQEKWTAFAIGCRHAYAFDPEKDGPLAGAERLGRRDGAWQAVWDRFVEAPTLYPGVPDWLRRARPADKRGTLSFPDDLEPWPQDNDRLEDELRKALTALGGKSEAEARATIAALEKSHGHRRAWPWAKFGWAPLARALEHLAAMTQGTGKARAGGDLDAMAQVYGETGWRTDAAVLDALAAVERAEDTAAVTQAIRAVYEPWLTAGAARFQQLAAGAYPASGQPQGASGTVYETPAAFRWGSRDVEAEGAGRAETPATSTAATDAIPAGCCLLFADGLRLDVGQKLLAEIEARGWPVEVAWSWVGVPTVTATTKPAVSPVASLLTGDPAEDLFRPCTRNDSKVLTHDRFTRLLEQQGIQFLEEGETGDPTGRAWTECGRIDAIGHKEGVKLARRIAEEVRGLIDRLRTLLDAGWREVRVATDHGWLLLPGGLPKVVMPACLTETQWGRCAIVRENAKVEVQVVPWSWCGDVPIAVATGIGAFRAGLEYDHGGLSLQECLVPRLTVRGRTIQVAGKIESVVWRGLRCRVEVSGAGDACRVHLRVSPGDLNNTLEVDPQLLDRDGRGALLVTDDSRIGQPAVVVLISPEGQVVAKRSTLIGGED